MLEGPRSKVEPSGGAEGSGMDRNSGRKVSSNCQSDHDRIFCPEHSRYLYNQRPFIGTNIQEEKLSSFLALECHLKGLFKIPFKKLSIFFLSCFEAAVPMAGLFVKFLSDAVSFLWCLGQDSSE